MPTGVSLPDVHSVIVERAPHGPDRGFPDSGECWREHHRIAGNTRRGCPRDPTELFWACTVLALQGFGGVLAVAQRELVERRRWLTSEQFLQDWAVAQVLPGPNVVNLALMIGARHLCWRGAAAVLGSMLMPLALLLVLAAAFVQVDHPPVVQEALRGMGAEAAGLVMGSAPRLAPALRGHPLGGPGCVQLTSAAFVSIAWLRWPLLWVLLPPGGIGWVWAAWALKRQRP